MAKPKRKYAKCPCCKTEKHRTEMETAISILEKIQQKELKHYKELKIDSYDSFIDSSFEWACDACLKSKKAILANPGLQTPAWNNHLYYFDSPRRCSHCGEDFIFSKEEKQLWYEKLKFSVYSEPIHCLKCRKIKRKFVVENNTLSEILKKKESDISPEELEKVIEIYEKWNKEDRAKYYKSLLKKKKK